MQLHIIGFRHTHIDALIVVVNSHGKRLLGILLSDNILIQNRPNILWLRNILQLNFHIFAELFLNDLIAELYTFIADVDAGTCNEFSDLFLGLAAKRTFQLAFVIPKLQHDTTPISPSIPISWPSSDG